MIQRQLQQVEEKQRQLEKRGVMVEKALRGEAGTDKYTLYCQFQMVRNAVFAPSVYI